MSRADGRIDGFYITTDEWDLLAGVSHLVRSLYLFLLMRRDFKTNLVGARHPNISWEALCQDLTVESHPGIQRDKPSHDQVRRACGWLVRRGLVKMRSNEAQRHLIFFLPLARRRDFLSEEKPPVSRQTKPPEGSHRENGTEAARPTKQKAATHQGSVYQHHGTTSGGESVDNLIVSSLVAPTEKGKILNAIRAAHVNGHAQEILDEHAWYAEKGAIRKTHVAFVLGCIKKLESGTFEIEKGKEIAARRAKRAQDQRTGAAPTPTQDDEPRRRRRPDMGPLREFLPNFGKGKR